MEKGNNNVIKIVVGVIAVVAVIAIVVGVVFLTKTNKTTESGNNSSQTNNNETKKNDTKKSNVVMYINDYKIVLGETKISDIVDNTKLSVICHDINTFTDSKTNKTSEYNFYKLTDGVNTISVQSVADKTDVVLYIYTLKDGNIKDPAFDSSKGTTIEVEDINFKNNIKIGDILNDKENLNSSNILSSSYNITYSTQTNGNITYYRDEDNNVINISAYAKDSNSVLGSNFYCSAE
ncbi:MAG: hypothetical protein E7160_05005 [Firmicutes bacterium]|nr:hypothetical protein [Bacillota bacterium]